MVVCLQQRAETSMASDMDLHSMRVKELTEMCKKFGIKTGGRKAEIVERLQSHPAYLKESKGSRASTPTGKKRGALSDIDGPSSHNAKKQKNLEKPIHGAINKLFDEFQDPEEPDTMTVDGIQLFFDQLGVDSQDPVVLVLSYFMEADAMCVYTRGEFIHGLEKLNCGSIDALQKKLPTLRKMLTSRDDLSSIYSYSFTYAKDPSQKSLALDIALELWKLLLPGYFPLLPQWLQFVKNNCRNSVSKDLWMQVLEFGSQVNEDLSNFDENGAWPVLIDDYVTHMQERIASIGLEAVKKEGDDGDAIMEDA